ncbi:MAG: hypothetical protein ACRDV3_05235 [Acidothermaceae bacterium]
MNTHRLQQLSAAVVAAGLAGVGLTGCGGHSGGGSVQGAANANPLPGASAGGGAALTDDAGGGGGGGSKAIDVCSLLSAAQASSIVGVTYTSAQPTHDMCNYPSADAPYPMFIIVSSTDTQPWTQAMFILQEDGGASPSPVSGVGDRAAGSGGQFDVQDGNWIIDVHGGDPLGQTGDFSKSTALAKVVIAGLH